MLAGAIVVLHPFSKKMGFNPHLHILVTEGGFDKNNKFIHQKFISFRSMRKTWQYQVLTNFKAAFPGNREFSMLVDHLFKKYPEGFYAHLPEESRITNCKHIANGVIIQRLNNVNTTLGRKTPVIITPEEILEIPEGGK